nr:hypothetical protein [Tanacetum cinerariifolium]
NVSELLMSGDITVGVCLTRELPANAKRKMLRRMQPMVVRADAGTDPITLDEYCTRPHVVVSYVANISIQHLAGVDGGNEPALQLAGPPHPGHAPNRAARRSTALRDAESGAVDGLAQRDGHRPGRTLAAQAA